MTGEYSADVLADLEVMVAQSLARWNLSPETGITLLNVSENATFALRDESAGRELVLRVHRLGYSSADEIRSELAWIDALRREAIIETATPLVGVNGEYVQTLPSPSAMASRHAVAFERLPGREPDSGTGAAAEGWFERLGKINARMHLHAKTWTLPEGFRRKRWDTDAMVGPEAFWGPWRAAIGLDTAGAAVLERTVAYLRQRLERFGMDAERFGLVHADLRLANLLADGTHLRIIDFDDCGFSWFLYDFATAVSFIEHEPHVPALLSAWLSGYRTVAPLGRDEQREIPTFVILRRIMLTAWLASHVEVPYARSLGAAYTQETVGLAEQFLGGRFLV